MLFKRNEHISRVTMSIAVILSLTLLSHIAVASTLFESEAIVDNDDDGMDDKLGAYNFPDKWDNVSWHKRFDMTGDDESEWGLLGTSREDGRTMLMVKDAVDRHGLIASYA